MYLRKIIFVVVILMAMGCSQSSDKIQEKRIIGTWYAVEKYGVPIDSKMLALVKNVFVFHENHLVESIYIKKGRVDKSGKGTWELSYQNDINILNVSCY